ncbi:hypothetical protein D3C71_1692630 [compost metagenome]
MTLPVVERCTRRSVRSPIGWPSALVSSLVLVGTRCSQAGAAGAVSEACCGSASAATAIAGSSASAGADQATPPSRMAVRRVGLAFIGGVLGIGQVSAGDPNAQRSSQRHCSNLHVPTTAFHHGRHAKPALSLLIDRYAGFES